MKWFNKLTVLVRSLVSGPQPQRPQEVKAGPASGPAVPGDIQVEAVAVREDDLEKERVADLLQRRLVSSELGSQPGDKGD